MSSDGLRRVLVIGVGSIGERHVRCFQATGRCEVAIVEVQDTLRQTIAARYQTPSFCDLESALQAAPQAAVIATPAHLHLPIATQLARAGVSLLIEKPLSVGLKGAAELQVAVHQAGVQCGVAYVYRSHPVLAAMKAALDSGRFGRPVELVAVCGQHFPTYRPAYREIYYKDRATGGGAIQDALTHILNAGEWLLGPITRLVADAAHQVLPEVEVEDTVHLLARHGHVLANYSLNQHQAPNETTITVICERGVLRFEAHESRWRWMTKPGDVWHDEPHLPLERDTLFVAQADQFLDVLDGKRPVACSLEEGLGTLRVNLAALASLEQGSWQTIQEERQP